MKYSYQNLKGYATVKQKLLMDNLDIKYDVAISKAEASRLITERLEKIPKVSNKCKECGYSKSNLADDYFIYKCYCHEMECYDGYDDGEPY